ncbi:MAG: glycosyltransferase family 4 protein [Rickettsiales bacterium]
MKILFLHPNMPGQYKHLARHYGASGEHEVVFITKHKTAEIPGVKRITYGITRKPTEGIHRYLARAEYAVIQGQHVWRVCKQLKDQIFTPDIIIAHPGWGDALFVKEIFPTTPLLSFFEFYYRAQGADVGFDPAYPVNEDDLARIRMKNIVNQVSLEISDAGVSPTQWQWSLHPKEFQPKITVLHDGIDTDVCVPNPTAIFCTPSGKEFKRGDEVVTYIARNFEPYRGFPTFMKAAEILLRERPNLHIIAIGADGVSYGQRASEGKSYREIWSEKVSLDSTRIHWCGTVPYAQLLAAFNVSAAHIYLTYPFVLSWSMMEAMSCGVPLVASDTAPVREVVQHEQHGLLVDFFSPEQLAAACIRLLDDKALAERLRRAARETIVQHYALKDLLPKHVGLIDKVVKGYAA